MPSGTAAHVNLSQAAARPLDATHLNASTFGDVQLRQEIIRLFVSQLQQSRERLADAASVSDWRFVTHTLRGAAAAVGALELAELAATWERDGLPSSASEREQLLQVFDRSETAFRRAVSDSFPA